MAVTKQQYDSIQKIRRSYPNLRVHPISKKSQILLVEPYRQKFWAVSADGKIKKVVTQK